MGGIVAVFRPKTPKRRAALTAVPKKDRVKEEVARKIKAEEDEKKKSTAFKLAQIMTGAGGVLKTAKTSRRKLLGN